MSPAILTLLILLGAVLCFLFEVFPLAITSLLVVVALSVSKVLTPKEALAGFSNDTTILIWFMAPVGEALFKTGFGNWIGQKALAWAGKSQIKLIAAIMTAAAVLSAFSSNTGTTLVMAPLVVAMAAVVEVSPSVLLLPLAYAASFGGMLTLIGTPPNMIANGALKDATKGAMQFGFFDFGKVALPVTILGILYMMHIGRKQVPARLPVAKAADIKQQAYKTDKMWTSVAILVIVVVAMFFEQQISQFGLNLAVIAVAGAILTVVTRCLTIKEFHGSVEWTAVILFAGMLPLGTAMQKTGAAKMVAEWFIKLLPSPSPMLLTAMVILGAGVLAQFMSHTAATSILAPVCVALAGQLKVSPAPLLMALCQATSIAMATPIGTPPNVIVYEKGGYKFSDFTVTGLPIFIFSWIILTILVPVVIPF
ncbi:MAG: SLC13/DASS family transporter [Firmicutes bacterium]|nr:SLC13/DASS family transporter [Bacillota bacterium]